MLRTAGWVIWPTFSSSVMRLRRSATRAGVGAWGSWYPDWALAPVALNASPETVSETASPIWAALDLSLMAQAPGGKSVKRLCDQRPNAKIKSRRELSLAGMRQVAFKN
jgi:hypothetical protein